PEQPCDANASKCWNWFKAEDQMRDAGEPSLIAGIVRDVVTRHAVDPRRVFVAGLSAGAAMAVILGETYPGLFAGVGADERRPQRAPGPQEHAWCSCGTPQEGCSGGTDHRFSWRSRSHRAADEWSRDRPASQGCPPRRGGKRHLARQHANRQVTGWKKLHPHCACRRHRRIAYRVLDPARCRPCLVGRQRERLLHGWSRTGCVCRNGALLPCATARRLRMKRVGGVLDGVNRLRFLTRRHAGGCGFGESLLWAGETRSVTVADGVVIDPSMGGAGRRLYVSYPTF